MATSVRSPQPALSQNAVTVLRRRYLAKDHHGRIIETPLQMFQRVARNIAQAEQQHPAKTRMKDAERRFFEMMRRLDFLPNSPTIMNAGRELQQLSACFVLPVEDSLESIFDAVKHQALIHQSGGGTGFSFSHLRPKDDRVATTSGVASGPVSFMRVFNISTEVIKQGGCVVPDTRVSTNRGIVPIQELGPTYTQERSWHPHPTPLKVATDDGCHLSDEFYNHGIAPIRRIRTRGGYHLAATLAHRIRVIDDEGQYVWRRMEDLKRGDWVVLQKGHLLEPDDYRLPSLEAFPHHNASPVRFPSVVSERLGEFIGFVVGDGSFNHYNPGGTTGRLILTICDNQPDVVEWLTTVVGELFGLTPIAQKKCGDGSTNYFLNATMLVRWLHQLGVEKQSALTARVPLIVFRKGSSLVHGFLRGLFTADGTVSQDGYPSLSSVSEGLIDDVQQLLLAVGIPSQVSVITNRTGAFGVNPLYRLRITTSAGLQAFCQNVGFIDKGRRARLDHALHPAWEFNDVIPHQQKVLASLYRGPGRGSGPKRGSRGANRKLYRAIQHYLPDVAASRNLTRSRLAVLTEQYEEIRHSPLSWFLTNNHFYDQIESIKEGDSLTLDLSVPDNSTYIANGFVSHNTRRGANMGILRVDHPDILDFITVKQDPKEMTNFNLSVGMTDAFMRALERRRSYALVNPHTGRTVRRLPAEKVFDQLVEAAWRSGEPGVVFLDTINKHNPTPHVGPIEATNPCSEQPLLAYESCTLGSINVAHFVKGPEASPSIDYERLADIIPVAVRFLDNIIDMNHYPMPEIETVTKRTRKIGLGIMGFADLLIKLNIGYDTAAALAVADELMRFIQQQAHAASSALARERGVFPAYRGSRLAAQARRWRNATVTTIAPTGTISIIADCSPGIEPLYGVSFVRTVMEDVRLVTIHPEFVKRAQAAGIYSDQLIHRVSANESIQHLAEIPPEFRRLFVTAHDVSPEHHVRMQAAFQKYSDSGVSKTINLPPSATKDDVASAFLLAFRLGCKGLTVFRSGSRERQVLSCAQIQYC
jgi:ribonucleoside-diphosphate reductase alpha chain